MPRPKKVERPGARWHLTARGRNHETIFFDDLDFEMYIRLLGEVAIEFGWIVYAFCLIPNHIHLFIETPNPNLARGMQRLQSRYATYLNNRYGRDGHLFKGRYHWKAVEEDAYFINVAFYVVGNAAKHGFCKHPADWEWCSLGLVARGIKPRWLAHDLLVERLHELTGRSGFFEEWIG